MKKINYIFYTLLTLGTLVSCGAVIEDNYPAINRHIGEYSRATTTLYQSSCGFSIDGDVLTLSYNNGERIVEFPETIVNNIDNTNTGDDYTHLFTNTGIYVTNEITAVSVFDQALMSVNIHISDDMGKTWVQSAISMNSLTVVGDLTEDIYPYAQYLSFTSNTDGWLVITKCRNAAASGNFLLYHTIDGGVSWERVNSNLTEEYPFYVTGATFISDSHGYICFANAIESAPIFETIDGGQTWQQLDLLQYLPEEFNTYDSVIASSPVESSGDRQLLIPISYSKDGKTEYVLLLQTDDGKFQYLTNQ